MKKQTFLVKVTSPDMDAALKSYEVLAALDSGFNFPDWDIEVTEEEQLMTTKQAKKIVREESANIYAQIYDEESQKIAAQAFMDGMVFAKMVQAGAVSDDMINEDLFRTIREYNQ